MAEGGGAAVRVALMNDYEIVVQGLGRLLEPYRDRIHLIEYDSKLPVQRDVDVVLYDTFAQDQGDPAAIRRVLEAESVGKVVVYSWNVDGDPVQSAITRGAAGYLSKGMSAAELVVAIEKVHHGEQVTDRTPTGDVDTGDWPGRAAGLSAREAEVLALITQGLTNDEIARRTYLSINSVKSYIRSAYRKIGVTRRPQAVLWGVRNGFEPDVVRRPGPDAGD
jgi:NarL family two-component system response regulator LiaR